MRHSGPWTVALSAIPSAPWFHNPYMLERQQLISVFHRKAGLVIGGGNDKFNPGAATLCLLDGAEVWYNVPVAGSVRRRGRSEELTADFGPASGSIRATPRGPGRLELELGMEPRTADDISFVNHQIPVRKGMRLRFAGKPLRLTKRPVERRAGPRGAVLAFGRSRIRVPAGTAFRFPHRPYNSYGGDPHEYGPEGWVGLLSAELGSGGGSIEVTVEVD